MINASTVQNCNTSGTVKGNKHVGGMIGTISNSTLKGTCTKEMTVSGNSNVGGLAGYASTSTIEESSSNITVTATGNVAGGFIAEVVSSTNINNCYSMGEVNGKEDIGGFVGKLNSASIYNCFSNNTAIGTQAGGFISQSTNNANIQNSIAIGNQDARTYKFDNRTAKDQLAGYSNNYEYEKAKGKSIEIKETLDMRDVDFSDKIRIAKRADITNMDFYRNTLGWNNEIWDFTEITSGFIGIKGKYKDEKICILNPEITRNTYQISSAEEFIQKIKEDPDGIFEIVKDIDFTGKTYSGSLITSDFTGIIEGNHHTLSNCKSASVFNTFMGEVHNLNMSNFVNTAKTDYTALFAKRSVNAVFSNMKVAGSVNGRNYAGLISGEDTSSTFENITIAKYKNAAGEMSSQVIGNSNLGLLVGRKSGGSIKNCYVEGNLSSNSGSNIGGITGVSIGNVTIENVISNVYVGGNKASGYAGGFIGNISEDTRIKNSLSMGIVAGNVTKKFTGASDEIIAKTIQNCYEYNETSGNSNINENTNTYIKTATKENVLDKTFYINRVGLDEKIWKFDNLGKEVTYTRMGSTWTEQILYPELR